METKAVAPTPSTNPLKRTGYRLKPWKVLLLVLAGVAIVGGLILGSTSSASRVDKKQSGGGVMVSNFDGQKQTGTTTTADDPGLDWGGLMKRGGISFFIAFCLGFAFRSFLKLALMFVGIWAGSLFLLAQLGWLEVHWDLIDSHFNNLVGHLGEQITSLKHFVEGSLPSASSAGLGLFAGFKKG